MTKLKLIKTYQVENTYAGHGWSHEETYKYVFQCPSGILEAGFFLHYNDASKSILVKRVIELPLSVGCYMGCLFCASGSIPQCTPLTGQDMFDIYLEVQKVHSVRFGEPLLITFTGIGEIADNFTAVHECVRRIGVSRPKFDITLSSCRWTKELMEQALFLQSYGNIRKIQQTYVHYDADTMHRLIPGLCDVTEFSIAQWVNCVSEIAFNRFRLNYVALRGINDSSENVQALARLLHPVREKVLVRVSMLNKTKTSVKNGLRSASIEMMELVRMQLNEMGIQAYVFYSHKNDGMNCGQLITEA